MSPSRAQIVAEARSWLGTPYQHQASLKGVGCDCIGLVRGVWRAVVGAEPQPLPPYRPDWAELGGDEALLTAARRWLLEAPTGEAQPGDVLLFRMHPGSPIKHAAILSELTPRPEGSKMRMVHAYWGRTVLENDVGPWWRARLAGVFQFPGAR
jgi:NlpC/P60 family putative phage cell wall peptidase